MNPASNLFLIGPSGAGKTAVGRRLASHYELTFIDLDQAIEQRTGVDITTIFDIEGEAGFRQRESALLKELMAKVGVVMATGAGAILDAANRQWLSQNGCVLWLHIDTDEQRRRLARDRRRPLLATSDPQARLQAMAAERTPLYAATADLRVRGGREPVSRALADARHILDRHWQAPRNTS